MFPRRSSRSRDLGALLRAAVAPCVEALENRQLLSSSVSGNPLYPPSGVGVVTTPEAHAPVRAVRQSTGQTVVAFGSGGGNDGVVYPSLQRFNADGSPDDAFAVAVATFNPLAPDAAIDLAVAPGDKLVEIVKLSDTQQAVVRYNADGSLDTSFGTGGSVTFPNAITAVAVQADGKVVLAGPGANGTGFNRPTVFYRLNADGTPDATFGTNGQTVVKANFDASGTPAGVDTVRRLIVQSDGKIDAVVNVQELDYLGSTIVQLDANGQPTATKWDVPALRTGFFGYTYESIAQAPDGSLIVSGEAGSYGSLVRFGQDGHVIFADSPKGAFGATSPQFKDVVVTTDGKILAAGSASTDNGEVAYAERFNLDGSVDTTFGNQGIAEVPVTNGDLVVGALAEPQGQSLLVGYSDALGTGNVATLDLVGLTDTAAPPPGAVPNRPFALTATATSPNSVTVQFYDNSTDETGFIVERATSANGPYGVIGQVAPHAGTGYVTFTDTDAALNGPYTAPQAGTTYYYRVKAVNYGVTTDYEGPVSVTTPTQNGGGGTGGTTNPGGAPNAPYGLVATQVGTGVQVLFTDNANNETGFVIERATSANGPYVAYATLPAHTDPNPHSPQPFFNDSAVVVGQTYYYRVYAVNGTYQSSTTGPASVTITPDGGNGGGSQGQYAVPNAPFGLTAKATSATFVNVSFIDNDTGEAGFVVERATSANGPFTKIATLGPAAGTRSTVQYTDGTVTAGQTYYYRVYAINGPYQSGIAGPVSVTTPAAAGQFTGTPNAPFGGEAHVELPNSVIVSFYNNANNERQFEVDRYDDAAQTSGKVTFFVPQVQPVGAKVVYHDSTVIAGHTYYYFVRALSDTGASSQLGPIAVTVPVLGNLNAVPNAPTGLTAQSTGPSTVHLQFVNNADNQLRFTIERSSDPSFADPADYVAFQIASVGQTVSYDDTGLSPATTYYYRVYATNDALRSAPSAAVIVTTGR